MKLFSTTSVTEIMVVPGRDKAFTASTPDLVSSPDALRFMMYYNSYGKRDEARRLFRELPEHIKSSLASRDYYPAELVCPKKIKIGRAMGEAVRLLA